MPVLCSSKMPDAGSPSPMEKENMLTLALAIVEKKVRNLEKRKGKLDGYREDKRRGKELNEDQKAAVAKYDEVLGTLDFARELTGQFTKLASDEARDRKKAAKKEQQEKARVELAKVAYMLAVKELLSSLGDEEVLEDLAQGRSGAPVLTTTQIGHFTQLRDLVTPNKDDLERGGFEKQVTTSAEHLVALAEQKTRPVSGLEAVVQYKELAELIDTVRSSGYLETRWVRNNTSTTTENGLEDESGDDVAVESEEVVEETEEAVQQQEEEEEVEVKDVQINGFHHGEEEKEEAAKAAMLGQHQNYQLPVSSHHHQQQEQAVPAALPVPVAAPAAAPVPVPVPVPVAAPAPAPAPLEPSFNFLQESQIDLESPHMDPAVVMVHPPKRPPLQGGGGPPGIPSQTYSNPIFQAQMQGLTPAQQAQIITQQQALLAQQQYQAQQPGPYHQQPKAPAQPAPFTQQSGPVVAQNHSQISEINTTPAFSQATAQEPAKPQAADPRPPRVPETVQHEVTELVAQNKTGYPSQSGGTNKQPDSEIGTWGAEEGEDEGRGWGGRGRGRGGGGRGNRGYSRGSRGGDRGSYRGGEGGRGGYRDRGDRRERGGGGGERREGGAGDRQDRPERKYDGERRGYSGGGAPRGRGSGRGGYRGDRGGGSVSRGNGNQNGYSRE